VAIGELATRDFIRGELSRILTDDADDEPRRDKKPKTKKKDPVA
jgi:hypothetical protein